MKPDLSGILNPLGFLQAFIVQSIKVAEQQGCSACVDPFNLIELIGLGASDCFEGAARGHLGVTGPLSLDDYAEVIVDIKNHIGGRFSRLPSEEGVVTVTNTRCPFGERVKEAPELCRMTSSVFGGIAARNFGYAKVELKRRIAAGDGHCEVCIYTDPALAEGKPGQEYRNHQGTLVAKSGTNELSVRVAEKMDRVWCPTNPHPKMTQTAGRPVIVAESDQMRRALEAVELVAPTQATVFISGETGVGKEIIARALHALSGRSGGEFVAVNCGAIPQDLIESLLFGHEKGAFTSAHEAHCGLFERAEGGTLFLDEIDSLPLLAQAKLLRVLQEGEYERVGGRKILRASARVVAASNRLIEELVSKGEFRSDLYYRLNVVPIYVPPLRERREDLSELANLILRRLSDKYQRSRKVLSNGAWSALMTHAWPGNVRELENVLERAFLFAAGKVIEDVGLKVEPSPRADNPAADVSLSGLKKQAAQGVEMRMLREALFRNSGNVSAVAREIGITARAVHQKLRAQGIDPAPYRARQHPPVNNQ